MNRTRAFGIILFGAFLGLPQPAAGQYTPDCAKIRAGLARPTIITRRSPVFELLRHQNTPSARITNGHRDSIWKGLLIGAGIGATGGYIWARNECGDDPECAAITNRVGILVGGAIGAAVGAILDALSR